MKVYIGPGSARLACPKAKSEDGHMADVHFIWQDGSEHADHHQAELRCSCGELLFHVGETDPWKHPFVEVGGVPHNER